MAAIISDLHWLIHEGHVIEFASGVLEAAKAPAPRPPTPPRAEKHAGVESETALIAGEEPAATDAAAMPAVAAEAEKPESEMPVAATSPVTTAPPLEPPSADSAPPVAGV